MAELIKIYPENPNPQAIKKVVDIIRAGGLVIYPSDTVYALGCDITNNRALERIARIKGVKLAKANFSFVCADLSNLSDYVRQINTSTFKLLKRALPGPYTFILKASHQVPKIIQGRRSTVGMRIPNHNIPIALVLELGRPIITASLKADDDFMEYYTDAEDIYDDFDKRVDAVIDGGVGGMSPSTVIDCTQSPPELIREGAGPVDFL